MKIVTNGRQMVVGTELKELFEKKLKRLEKRYDVQNRTRELTKEGSRYDDVSRT